MKIRLWGVRGSLPVPGPDTMKYGGNTTCIELRFGEQARLIIIDAGSGIRLLANEILKHDLAKGPIRAEIFFTHTHWDHILGFPFFVPNFIRGTQLKIYGPTTFEDRGLEKAIGDQLSYRYFPIRQSELAAQMEFHALQECQMDLGDGLTLRTKHLNHPLSCLGYRFERGGKAFCTAFDAEPFTNVFPTDPQDPNYDQAVAEEGELAAQEEDAKMRAFFEDADLLVHDAQYTEAEYLKSKKGWGHSSMEYAIRTARQARVKKLVLFHHDVARTDRELDALAERYCAPPVAGETEVLMAREGLVFEL